MAMEEAREWEDLNRLIAVLDGLLQLSPELMKTAEAEINRREHELAIEELEKWPDADHESDIDLI